MRSGAPLSWRGSRWLLAVVGVATIPTVAQLPIWSALMLLGGVVWRYAIDRFGVVRPSVPVKAAGVALAAALTFSGFGTWVGREPGAAMLAALLGLKLAEARSYRDGVAVILLSLLVALTWLVGAPSLGRTLWFVAAVGVIFYALVRATQPTFDGWRSARLVLRLGALSVPLAALAWLAFPPPSSSPFALPRAMSGTETGIGGELRPGSVQSLAQSDRVAMRVFFDGPIPPARERYFRGVVLRDPEPWGYSPGAPMAIKSRRPTGPSITQEILLEPSGKTWLFALDWPARAPDGARLFGGSALEVDAPITEALKYRVASWPRSAPEELSVEERYRSLALTPTIGPRTAHLAEQLSRSERSAAGIATAIESWMRAQGLRYSMRPPVIEGDVVEGFLFGTRTGFCEHFAAAEATLLRAAGVPSRIVLGYQGGEVNENGGYVLFRQADAHAWVEYWDDVRGWIRTDPTARVAPERVHLGGRAFGSLAALGIEPGGLPLEKIAEMLLPGGAEALSKKAEWWWDAASIEFARASPRYEPEVTRSARSAFQEFLRSQGRNTLIAVGFIVLVGVGIPLVAAWARRDFREDPARRTWLRFQDKLKARHIDSRASEAPLEYARRASRALPAQRDDIMAIAGLYLSQRYGRIGAPDELARLREAVSRFGA